MDQPPLHVSAVDERLAAGLDLPAAPIAAAAAAPGIVPAARPLDLRRLINRLNYLNFQNRTVVLEFEHARYGDTLRLEARPQPCEGCRLRCTWVVPRAARRLSTSYVFNALFAPDEQSLLRGTGRVASFDEDGVTIELAAVCIEVDRRRMVRHPGREVQVELLSSGTRFLGTLVDFSPLSFRVRVHVSPPRTFAWLSTSTPVTAVLSRGGEVLYSGNCRILSHAGGRGTHEYVLEPPQVRLQRFDSKQYRSVRQELVPAPTAVFEHPLMGRLVSLKVADISACGFAVEESTRGAVLMPGLMIPRLELSLASGLKLPCRAQVVYRQPAGLAGESGTNRCGLALLDMDAASHVQLVGLLHQASDGRAYVCDQVDADELWSFFFETGFIYPEKYEHLQRNQKQIKETYEKLYRGNPSIARHFICRDRGKLVAHMAMLRFFDNTWLIHHHAALGQHTYKAGLNVLSQVGRFITDSHRFAFMHMEYVVCFYRPENHFPSRVFGGACRSIDDPRQCSEALFAYGHVPRLAGDATSVLDGSSLTAADDDDLQELSRFCRHQGGGLLLGALALEAGDAEQSNLVEEYRRLGLKRERHVYALKQGQHLLALAMVNLADIGLNLSDLTNCVFLFVLDEEQLAAATLHLALSLITKDLGPEPLPVLVYPATAAEGLRIPVDKHYMMWSLAPQYSDGFHRYTHAILRAGRRNGDSHETRRSSPV
jgi:hypothetical protein